MGCDTSVDLRPGSHLHFIGIGGIGMSAIAQVLNSRVYTITGSDISESEMVIRLRSLGIHVFVGHRRENILGADAVVFSSAIHKDNPELVAAQEKGVPTWHRALALASIVNRQKGIVVTGTHGKTTITAMTSFLFHRAGLRPTCLVGGILDEFRGNAVSGDSQWVVAEGDESDASFWYLRPSLAIVNNIDCDHMDHFSTLEELKEAFRIFLLRTAQECEIWVSADCPSARSVAAHLGRSVRLYGSHEAAELRYTDYASSPSSTSALVHLDGRPLGRLTLLLPGRFNMHNSLAAVAAGLYAGLPFAQIAEVLSLFSGTRRRLEFKGRERGITVIDDYAHHPTEIRATVSALRERYHGRRVGVFQPHRYSRTHSLCREFSTAFRELDLLVLTDIYGAGELPKKDVNGEVLFRETRRNHREVVYVPRLEEIPDYLIDVLREGDVLITMGAGNVWRVGEELLNRLARAGHVATERIRR